MGRATGVNWFYFTANQDLAFHPGKEEVGVPCKLLLGPQVSFWGCESIWFLCNKKEPSTNVTVFPVASIGESERTLIQADVICPCLKVEL